MAKPSPQPQMPSALAALTAVWMVVFTLVLHLVGFTWSASLIVRALLGSLTLVGYVAVLAVGRRR